MVVVPVTVGASTVTLQLSRKNIGGLLRQQARGGWISTSSRSGLGMHGVFDGMRAGVEQIAIRAREGEKSRLAEHGVELIEPAQLDFADIAHDVLAEIAEQDRL